MNLSISNQAPRDWPADGWFPWVTPGVRSGSIFPVLAGSPSRQKCPPDGPSGLAIPAG